MSEGKPNPEPYLRAVATLGEDPSACVALEDNISGVRAAAAAGYGVVIGVLTTNGASALLEAGATHTFVDTASAIPWCVPPATTAAERPPSKL